MAPNNITVEVVYGDANQQTLLTLQVTQPITIEAVIQRCGILQLHPEIDLTKQKVGIFSKTKTLEDEVKAGDRIEIYRPLLIDPKEARRAKARRAKKKN